MEIRRCPACRKIAADSRAVSCPGCETPLVLADEKSLLGEVFGSYRLVDVLGAGGMGVVFRARHETLLREAALKLVRPSEAQETFAKRFLQEARLLAELEHPNIVSVYDFAVTAWGDPFLVMELLPGRALADVLAEAPQGLPPTLVAVIVADVAAGLAHSHAHGVVHRDLKPSNVFLVDRPPRPLAKLLDFGIAKPLRADPQATRLTQSAAVVGTPMYLSPEQLRGEQVGPASDQYALALVICELLTGRAVREGHSLTDIVLRDIAQPIAPPVFAAGVPTAAARALARATHPEPKRRFANLAEFVAALELPPTRAGRELLAEHLARGRPASAAATPRAAAAPAGLGEELLPPEEGEEEHTHRMLTGGSYGAVVRRPAGRPVRLRWLGVAAAAALALAALVYAGLHLRARAAPDGPLTHASFEILRSRPVPPDARAVLGEAGEIAVLAAPDGWYLLDAAGAATRITAGGGRELVGALPGFEVEGGELGIELAVREGNRLLALQPVSQSSRLLGELPPEAASVPVDWLAISPRGDFLAVVGEPGTAVFASDGERFAHRFSVPASQSIRIGLVAALSERHLAVVEGQGNLEVWSLAESRRLWQRPFPEHRPLVVALADGVPYLAIGGKFSDLFVARLDGEGETMRVSGAGEVRALEWIPDRPTLVAGGEHGLATWTLAGELSVIQGLPGAAGLALSTSALLALDREGRKLNELAIGSLPAGTRRLALGNGEGWAAIAPAGETGIYVGGSAGPLARVDPRSLEQRVEKIHDDGITSLVAAGDSLASASDDRTIAVWKIPDLKVLWRSRAHDYLINALALRGDTLWTSSSDRTLKSWSWPGLELRSTLEIDRFLPRPAELHALWVSPDQQELLVGTWGRLLLDLRREGGEWRGATFDLPSHAGYRIAELGKEALLILGLSPRGLYLFERDSHSLAEVPLPERMLYDLVPAGSQAVRLVGPSAVVTVGLERLASGRWRYRTRATLASDLGSVTAATVRGEELALATATGDLLLVPLAALDERELDSGEITAFVEPH